MERPRAGISKEVSQVRIFIHRNFYLEFFDIKVAVPQNKPADPVRSFL
jgi:hypothetical protein